MADAAVFALYRHHVECEEDVAALLVVETGLYGCHEIAWSAMVHTEQQSTGLSLV